MFHQEQIFSCSESTFTQISKKATVIFLILSKQTNLTLLFDVIVNILHDMTMLRNLSNFLTIILIFTSHYVSRLNTLSHVLTITLSGVNKHFILYTECQVIEQKHTTLLSWQTYNIHIY